MSYIPGDRPFDEDALTDLLAGQTVCELCHEDCILEGDNNYCQACQDLVDAEEMAELSQLALPILQPITVMPVELNAALWAEFRAEAEEGCEHCGSMDVNPKCPACAGIERYAT